MGLFGTMLAAWRKRRLRRVIAVRLDGDPVTVGQILLMFRMILADGVVRAREMEAFEAICIERFSIRAGEMPALHSYLERRQAVGASGNDIKPLQALPQEERERLIGHMKRIAACGEGRPMAAGGEGAKLRFIRETAASLGVACDLSGAEPANVARRRQNDAHEV